MAIFPCAPPPPPDAAGFCGAERGGCGVTCANATRDKRALIAKARGIRILWCSPSVATVPRLWEPAPSVETDATSRSRYCSIGDAAVRERISIDHRRSLTAASLCVTDLQSVQSRDRL